MTEKFDERETYPPIDESEEDLCRTLWLAVAAQGQSDAVGTSSSSGGERDQADAIRWINGSGRMAVDFDMVAHLAGVEPGRLRKRFQKLLAEGASLSLRPIRKEFVHNRGQEDRAKYLKRARQNELARKSRLRNSSTNKRRK